MPDAWIQYGALGIVGFVLIYFVKWLTTKFNGSIADNTAAIRKNTEAVTDMTIHDRAIRESLDEIKASNERGFKEIAEAIEQSNEETLRRLWNLVKRDNAKFEKEE